MRPKQAELHQKIKRCLRTGGCEHKLCRALFEPLLIIRFLFSVNFLRLSFLPVSVDFGLLILRLVSGGAMFWLHGKDKFTAWSKLKLKFSDIIVNSEISLGLTIFAELVCAGLLILGLFGRFAALILAITMGVAFFKVHKMKLSGEGSGELALLYLMAYVALVLAGPGKFSVDGSSASK